MICSLKKCRFEDDGRSNTIVSRQYASTSGSVAQNVEQLDIESERQELLEFFEIKHLKEMAALKKEQSLDLRFEKENKQFEWIQD